MRKAIVVFSGGQDSTTCLYWAIREGYDVHLLTFYYGQRHDIEIQAAFKIAALTGLSDKHEIVNLSKDILKSCSPLTDLNAPLEQYANHQSLPGGIEKTFVPMRNQLFLTIAANRALAIGSTTVITGVCQEDFGGYPDCRHVFIRSLEETSNLAIQENYKLEFLTPLMHLTKAESVLLANSLPGCMGALAYSHTAYDGKYPPIGKDHASLLRAKGFEQADIPDPLVLRAVTEGVMELPDSANYKGFTC